MWLIPARKKRFVALTISDVDTVQCSFSQVKLSDEKSVSGKLEAVNEKGIVLTTSGDKKKKLPPETLNIPYESMVESKVIISFK